MNQASPANRADVTLSQRTGVIPVCNDLKFAVIYCKNIAQIDSNIT